MYFLITWATVISNTTDFLTNAPTNTSRAQNSWRLAKRKLMLTEQLTLPHLQ